MTSYLKISVSLSDGSTLNIPMPQWLPDKVCLKSYFCPEFVFDYPDDTGEPVPKTFVVIARRFKGKAFCRFSSKASIFIFKPWHPVRRFAVYVVTNQIFEYFIMITILLNCIFLAFINFPDTPEYVFLGIYTFELLVKVLARGFFIGRYSYLRDPWNWLDFILVVIAFLTETVSQLDIQELHLANISGFRTFRVLRALRTVSVIPGLKIIVNALLRAFKMLIDVIILTLFCLMIFALVGLQVYMGVLRNRCVNKLPNFTQSAGKSFDAFYKEHINNNKNWIKDEKGNWKLCGNASGAGQCPDNYSCLPDVGENPNYGYTNFDNFWWSMLTSFQLITMDFWEDVYTKILHASGPWNVFFFIIVVFFGSYYLVNLMLAVVAMSYQEEAEHTTEMGDETLVIKPSVLSDLKALTIGTQKTKMQIQTRRTNLRNRNEDHLVHEKVISSPKVESKISMISSVTDMNQDGSRNYYEGGQVLMVFDEKKKIVVEVIDRNPECFRNTNKHYIRLLRIQNAIYVIVMDPFFHVFITIAIILNTIIMSTEHYNMTQELISVLNINNYIFIAIFLVEAILKISACSKFYFASGWNIFDLIIILSSMADLFLENLKNVSFLRVFRLLRVFKLAQSWPTMRILLTIIINTLGALGNLTFILVIVVYIFAVIGLELFHEKYTEQVFSPDPIPRWNFNDFFHSFMMVFRVLCGEWVEPLWDCMRASREICMVVFIPTIVLGHFIVLNLFLAMLLNSFATDSLSKHTDPVQVSDFSLAWQRLKRIFLKQQVSPSKTEPENGEFTNRESIESICGVKPYPDVFEIDRSKYKEFNVEIDSAKEENVAETKSSGGKVHLDQMDNKSDVDDCFPTVFTKRIACCNNLGNTNFGKKWYTFRKYLLKVVDHKVFETVILLIIMASSISLAFEDAHLYEKPSLALVLYHLNIIFGVLFFIEMVLKCIAYGLKTYFTNFWTLLDFFIVVISVASIVGDLYATEITALRSLRTLRALRPLRAISMWQGMKIVVNALMFAIPSIFNVLLVCFVFWLIFSIMGVQIFAGKFHKCIHKNGTKLSNDVVKTKNECLAKRYTWRNSIINFDSVSNGYLALLQVATFEGWLEIMEDAVDSTDVDQQPSFENNLFSYLYFVAFIIFGSFFTLNLFIGVIIDNFSMLKRKYEGSYLDMFLTPSQRTYYNTLKRLGNKKPQKTIKRPSNKCHGYFYDISNNFIFDVGVLLIIFLNVFLMFFEHYNQPKEITLMTESADLVFVAIFTIEAAIKIIGLRWYYFTDAWNVFDFMIVFLSVLGLILENFLKALVVNPRIWRIARFFKISRVLRLIKAAKGMQKLLLALFISLPAIINVGALLSIIMFIYSVIGMSLFMFVKLIDPLDELVNFQTFGNSFLILIRLSTAAGWNDILDSLMITPDECDNDFATYNNGTKFKRKNGDCGIPMVAVVYIVSYILIISVIIVNLYIAVILENFYEAQKAEYDLITEENFENFYSVWEKYDPLATQFIQLDKLSDFVNEIESPLGIPQPNEIKVMFMKVPIIEGEKLHFLDILLALVKHALGEVEETKEFQKVHLEMESKFQKSFPTRVRTVIISNTLERKVQTSAALKIQHAWNRYKIQKKLKNIVVIADTRHKFCQFSSCSCYT